MKINDALRKAAELLDLAASTLDTISALTTTTKDDKAADILKAIATVVANAQKGFDGIVSPAEVKKELTKLKDSLKANRDAALAALKKKFEKKV